MSKKQIVGAGGGGCFRAGTKVLQAGGISTCIEDIKVGDLVLSYSADGIVHESKVLEVHIHTNPEPLLLVEFWRGFVCITPNHWVLNQYNSFVEVGTLTKEDAFIDCMGHLRPITSITPIEPEPVYNLTVSDNHTFIANDIRVHNGGYRARFPIVGSGGGGGGKGGGGAARVAQESPDSLHSKQYAKLVDLVSEGEIEGLVNGLKSVYLNNTPLQSADGTMNFSDVSIHVRNGTQNQQYIPGFTSIEAESGVNVEISSSSPIVRTISNPNADALRITISTPSLTFQDTSNGDLTGTSVSLMMEVNNNGEGWKPVYIRTTNSTMSLNGPSAVSQVSTVGYVLDIGWTGLVSEGLQTFTGLVEYKLISSSTWTSIGNVVFSGSSYTQKRETQVSVFDYEVYQYVYRVGYVTDYYPPSSSSQLSGELPEGQYEFRVTKVSGIGVATFNNATAIHYTSADTISGKTTSRYQRSYRVELEGSGPWDIRISKLTADSTTSNVRNSIYWDSYTELIDSKLRYPNSAIIAVSIDSEQFSSIPSRGYEIKGLKVRVPSNYNPVTREYTGIWNGTFVVAWTDNPAWCFYDLVTNERYGLGTFISADQIDKWSLYNIAQYCDTLVPDGYGGVEPRFTCNLYLQSREEAFKVVNNMASIFRAIIYWSGGSIIPVQDSPSTPISLYTSSNVIKGEFTYQGSSARVRHTVALVSWNDPKDFYKQRVEYVESTEGIERYGVVQTEIMAVGCTSRGQAHRLGKWILYTEQLESETISFKAGLDGFALYPGAIFKVSDPVRSGERRGGRLVDATTTQVTVDDPVVIDPTKNYTLYVSLPDGTVESQPIVVTAGSHSVLQVVAPFTEAPQKESVWILASENLQPETWRVISIKEEEEGSVIEVTGLSYREDKFAIVEEDAEFLPIPTSSGLHLPPEPVTGVTIQESLYMVGLGTVGTKVNVSWLPVKNASRYLVRYSKPSSPTLEASTVYTSIDLMPFEEGLFTFSIVAFNSLGVPSSFTSVTQEIRGKRVPPAQVSNFNIAAIGNQAFLTWDASTELDVLNGGYMRIRHSPDIVSPEWNNAIDIGPTMPGMSTSTYLPLLSGTYFAKWVDSTGNASTNYTYITTEAASFASLNVLESIVESPNFLGAKTGMLIDTTTGYLKLDGSQNIDSITTLIDSWGYLDAPTGTAAAGSYAFQNTFDLGAVYTSRVSANILVELFDSSDFIDGKMTTIDNWLSLDGTVIDNVFATLMVRTTNDDPEASPTWSNWVPFFVGDWTTRAYQFRLDVVNASNASHNLYVKELGVTIDMPDRTESGNDVAATGSAVVNYSPAFKATPSVSIATQNMSSGDYYTITSKSNTGFTINFFNSSNSPINRTFDWQAKGY